MLMPNASTSVVFVGPGALVAKVRRGARHTSCRLLGSVENLADAPEALAPLLRGTPRRTCVVTLPADACVVRPIALGLSGFNAARAELLRAAEEMFPFTGDDAMLGYLARANEAPGSTAAAESGWLIAAQRSRVADALRTVEDAIGGPPAAVLAPHHAMLGLGLGSATTARITESTPLGQQLVHTLRLGVPSALAEAPTDAHHDHTDAHLPARLPDDTHDALTLAAAAPLALDVARSHIKPIAGNPRSPAARFALPAAAGAIAATLALTAFALSDARYATAADRLEQQQANRAEEEQRVAAQLQELRDLVAKLDAAQRAGAGADGSMMPTLEAAFAVLPERGFFERVSVREQTVLLGGAAARAQDVLRGLEGSPAFGSASLNNSVGRFAMGEGETADYETFDLTARRIADHDGTDPR